MLTAIYIRVSSRKQIQGESLEDQLAMCRAYIARMGWTEYRVYVEPGRSAFTEKLDKRIAFQELRADAQARKFQGVLVYKMNRFARKAFIQYQVAAEFDRYKVQIASATEPIDRKTANGRLTFGVLAVIAEAQSDGLSEVMRDKRLNEAKKGRHVGPAPAGYDRVDGTLRLNSDAEGVRWAFRHYMQGETSFRLVAAELNARGFTNRSAPYTTFGVEEMLKNPVYIGSVRCKDYVHPNAHAPLIDQATWEAVQELITRRGNRRLSVRPAPLNGDRGLLTDLAFCARCGARMWYQPNSVRYYRCSQRARSCSCDAPMAHAPSTEIITLATLASLSIPAAALAAAAADIQRLSLSHAPTGDRAAIEAKIRRLAKLYEVGLKSDQEFETELALLRRQLAATEEHAPIDDRLVSDTALTLLRDLPTLLQSASAAGQRMILAQCIDRVLLDQRAVVTIYAKPLIAPALIAANERLRDADWRRMCVEWAGWVSGRNCKHTPSDPDVR